MLNAHVKSIVLSIHTNGLISAYSKKVDFAIFSAMPEELDFFNKCFSDCDFQIFKESGFEFKMYIYNNKKILLAQTGLGTTFAASVLTFVHNQFHPNYIFLSGTAGGINTELNLRDVVIVEKAFEAEIQGAHIVLKGTPFESCLKHPLINEFFPPIYSASDELLKIAKDIDFLDLNVHHGTVVSSNSFPAPKELFERIKEQKPFSIDMETSAFYQVAWLLKIPVIAVRGISNVLNHDGSDEKIHESDVSGSAKAAAMVLIKIIDKLIFNLSNKHALKSSVEKDVEKLITQLNLQPHPEGGYYARTYQSTIEVKSTQKTDYDDETRLAGTSIYYLLNGDDFSAWHNLKSDEIWHYYKGSSVKIYEINKDGILLTHLLGDPFQEEGACFQVVIRANTWFAAEITNKSSYSLVGCTVSPGFDFKDFKLADRKYLSTLFPQHSLIINRLTRVEREALELKSEEPQSKIKLMGI